MTAVSGCRLDIFLSAFLLRWQKRFERLCKDITSFGVETVERWHVTKGRDVDKGQGQDNAKYAKSMCATQRNETLRDAERDTERKEKKRHNTKSWNLEEGKRARRRSRRKGVHARGD